MLSTELNKQIASYFGLEVLNTSILKTAEGDEIQAKFIWVADVSHFMLGRITICVVRTTRWHKGILLIRPVFPPLERDFGGPIPPYPLDVSTNAMIVENELRSVDFTYDNPMMNIGGSAYSFDLTVYTPRSIGYLHISNGPHSQAESTYRLWKAIRTMIYSLANQYNNEEINRFIGH